MGSTGPGGLCNSATFLPRLNIQTPAGDPGRRPPHAAKTASFQAYVAVIMSGV